MTDLQFAVELERLYLWGKGKGYLADHEPENAPCLACGVMRGEDHQPDCAFLVEMLKRGELSVVAQFEIAPS